MVSQRDIAEAAGVSLSTASLALNNHPRVSPKTALHVQQVAEDLGYVPNHAARQLIRARFGPSTQVDIRQIGLASCVSPTKKDALNPTDMAFLNGVEQGVADRSGVLVYLRHADGESSRRLSELTQAGTVEGWIVFGFVGDDLAALLNGLGRPWVALGDHMVSQTVHQATLDFHCMGELAVQHLLALGHRRIGLIGSHMQFAYSRAILKGFREAMAKAGLPVPADALLLREAVEDDVRPWLVEALTEAQALPAAPTAYLCTQAGQSASMLSVCAELQIRVPEELGIVFCEMSDSLSFVKGVTHVEGSAVEAGRSAVTLLVDIAGQKSASARQLLVTPHIVPGWSTDTCKGKAKE